MRSSAVYTLWLALAAGCAPPPVVEEDQPVTWSGAERAAIERARAVLAEHTGISSQLIGLVRVEARAWPDASLGCPRPGEMYAQVQTEGHVVNLKAGDRSYFVHVAGDNAIICEPVPDEASLKRRPGQLAAELAALQEAAHADLAKRLGVDAEAIRFVSVAAASWPDASLGCGPPGAGSPAESPVRGYVLTYETRQRLYRYHTDLQQLLSCPPIDVR